MERCDNCGNVCDEETYESKDDYILCEDCYNNEERCDICEEVVVYSVYKEGEQLCEDCAE